MNEALIREVAESIVHNEILTNWKLYALLGSIGILVSVVGNLVSSYFKKRAETYATKADLKEIIDQIRATTNATEQVRVALSHADWISKEWKTTRRLKLEELLLTVYSLESWIDKQRSIWLFNSDNDYAPSPIDKVKMIGLLYFPELKTEVDSVVMAYRLGVGFIHNTAKKAKVAGDDLDARAAILIGSVAEWAPMHRDTINSILALDAKASQIMSDFSCN